MSYHDEAKCLVYLEPQCNCTPTGTSCCPSPDEQLGERDTEEILVTPMRQAAIELFRIARPAASTRWIVVVLLRHCLPRLGGVRWLMGRLDDDDVLLLAAECDLWLLFNASSERLHHRHNRHRADEMSLAILTAKRHRDGKKASQVCSSMVCFNCVATKDPRLIVSVRSLYVPVGYMGRR